MMQFLRKKTEIPESKYGFAAPDKLRIVQIRKGLKNGNILYRISRSTAVNVHPPVPFLDLKVPVKDNDAEIDRIKYLL